MAMRMRATARHRRGRVRTAMLRSLLLSTCTCGLDATSATDISVPKNLPAGLQLCNSHGCSPRHAIDLFLKYATASPDARVVVMDVGANTGQFSFALVSTMFALFTEYRRPANASFHLFEPQATMQPILQGVIPKMQELGASVQLNQAAASTRDGNTSFFSGHNSETASMHHQTANGGHLKHGKIVRTVDLDAYLAASITPGDLVLFKLDIESSEFEVLPHLLRRPGGAVCRISFWLIEWHLWHVNWSPQKVQLRRTIEEQFAKQCAGVALPAPRVFDFDERYSMKVEHDVPHGSRLHGRRRPSGNRDSGLKSNLAYLGQSVQIKSTRAVA
jgi:FkbM family methyltransferase